MLKEYKTVWKSACVEIEEKRSRFICSVLPAVMEDEALRFIEQLRSKYWDATHNVYAYIIDGDNPVQRFSDDGEPSGTAGLPVLEAIHRAWVQNAAVVVTRYFGGTLLGAAGLVRTYGRSAQAGLQAAVIVRRLLCTQINIIVEYTLFGKLQNAILGEGLPIENVQYGQDVELSVFVPVDDTHAFMERMIELSNARIIMEEGEKTYITLDDEGNV